MKLILFLAVLAIILRVLNVRRDPAPLQIPRMPIPANAISLAGISIMVAGFLVVGAMLLYLAMFRVDILPQALVIAGAILFGCGWIATSIGKQQQ